MFKHTKRNIIASVIALSAFMLISAQKDSATPGAVKIDYSKYPGYTGSLSCRECHERFHGLWGSSFHGLAMQPFTPEFASKKLAAQCKPFTIEKKSYHFAFDDKSGWMTEKDHKGEKKFPLLHALGGKNVYYFLTLMDDGKLQTLPLGYDVRRREWFDTAASGIRHFPDMEDEAIHWTDRAYTFNTSCYGCHVSQLSTNYNAEKDSYDTSWIEQ